MNGKYRVFLNGKMYYPSGEDHPDVFFYITQDGQVGAFPKKMGKRFDPVLYHDAKVQYWIGCINGANIYAGDIVRLYNRKGCVVWDTHSVRFKVKWGNGLSTQINSGLDIRVLGNIYENPELLEGKP